MVADIVVEQIVADLSTAPEEQPAQQTTDWPVILFLFITLPVAFTYGGFWIGILALVVGMTALGWRRRHEGPFPTHRE